MTASERLVALCARIGFCSRNEAARYVKLGLVSVNGEVVQNAAAMVPSDASVELLERGKRMQANKVTIMLHKPLHYVTCRAPAGEPLVRKLLVPANRAPWCRTKPDPRHLSKLDAADVLDAASTGLLLFSQDGRVATKVSRDSDLEKEYNVEVSGDSVSDMQLVALREGLAAVARSESPQQVHATAGAPVTVEVARPAAAAAANATATAASPFAALRAAQLASKSAASAEADGSAPRAIELHGGDCGDVKATGLANADTTWLRILLRSCFPSAKIRHVCSLAGLRTLSVSRTRIGRVRLGNLQPGQWTVIRTEDLLESPPNPDRRASLRGGSTQRLGKGDGAAGVPASLGGSVQGDAEKQHRQPRVTSWKQAKARRQ